MNKQTAKHAFRASLPVMAGYVVLGMGFGVLMQSRGYAWYWAVLMSLAVYAGSMQYVAIDLLGAGAGMLTFALMTLAVNARHLFYGLSMLTGYRNAGKAKPYLIFALTDETFSLVCSPQLPESVDEKRYYLLVSAFNQLYWVLGSLAGALLGAAISFNSAGIEFSMTALFTVVVLGQWEKSRSHLPALTGFAAALACLAVFGPADFLLPALGVVTLLLLAEKRFSREGAEK